MNEKEDERKDTPFIRAWYQFEQEKKWFETERRLLEEEDPHKFALKAMMRRLGRF